MSVPYILVLDFDETIGHFVQINYFWILIKKYLNTDSLNEKYFFNILDTFPFFLRPNIFKLLKNLRYKKKHKICKNVIIYSNNTGPYSWIKMIVNYLNYKLKYPLIDKIIQTFNYPEYLELNFNSKSYNHLIKSANLKSNVKICFIDDKNHIGMKNENVNYIQVKPYIYYTDYTKMANVFYKKNIKLFKNIDKTIDDFVQFILNNTRDENYYKTKINSTTNYEKLLIDKIILNINLFFKINKTQSKRKLLLRKNYTRKLNQ